MSKEEVKNINTLHSNCLLEFERLCGSADFLEIYFDPEFRKGFKAGMKCLQMRFLKEMEAGQLYYVRK